MTTHPQGMTRCWFAWLRLRIFLCSVLNSFLDLHHVDLPADMDVACV